MRTVRIAVVDGNAALAGVLSELLADEPGFVVVGTAVTGAQALAIAEDRAVDLLLVDERLDDNLSLEVLDALRRACPSAAVALWSHHELHTATEQVDAVLPRGITFRELVRGLRSLLAQRPGVVDLRGPGSRGPSEAARALGTGERATGIEPA